MRAPRKPTPSTARAKRPRIAKQAKRAPASKGRAKASRQRLGHEVAQELLKLRPVLKEIGTALLDRLEGELTGVALSLNGGGLVGESPVLPGTAVLSKMLAEIERLKVKPHKGRLKDLRRVEALLQYLSTRIPPTDSAR